MKTGFKVVACVVAMLGMSCANAAPDFSGQDPLPNSNFTINFKGLIQANACKLRGGESNTQEVLLGTHPRLSVTAAGTKLVPFDVYLTGCTADDVDYVEVKGPNSRVQGVEKHLANTGNAGGVAIAVIPKGKNGVSQAIDFSSLLPVKIWEGTDPNFIDEQHMYRFNACIVSGSSKVSSGSVLGTMQVIVTYK